MAVIRNACESSDRYFTNWSVLLDHVLTNVIVIQIKVLLTYPCSDHEFTNSEGILAGFWPLGRYCWLLWLYLGAQMASKPSLW
ncbi:hypothetical protein AT705_22545 [Pseudoalteromonas rubra]|uniref:Uncharacterized protein n=1 Tax=Pseudoalteromonas rubra TaxID=43658 RepID=A0A0U2XCY8_9GAMM|nr:hypothetical protein AT705_22545 [Pseudoalteromonas rubra]